MDVYGIYLVGIITGFTVTFVAGMRNREASFDDVFGTSCFNALLWWLVLVLLVSGGMWRLGRNAPFKERE